jgi:hypothetical protein
MHPMNRERYAHDCLDKKIAMTPYLLDLEKCVTPKGHIFVSATPFMLYRWNIPFWNAPQVSYCRLSTVAGNENR